MKYPMEKELIQVSSAIRLMQAAAGPGGRAVGVDIGQSIVRQAAAAHPDVQFAVLLIN